MCNFCKAGSTMAYHCNQSGISLREVFPTQMALYPPKRVMQGRCALSGQEMSYAEMNPPGLTPRHLKENLYQAIINRSDKSTCAMCSEPLPDWKQQNAYQQPREIQFHFCNKCRDYFSLMAAVVHGDVNAIELFHGRQQEFHTVRGGTVPQITYAPVSSPFEDADVIDMQPVTKRDPAYVPR